MSESTSIRLIDAANGLTGSFSFGNNVLYQMCRDPNTQLCNPSHLSDMIWLIGRAYAASPERRDYGFVKSGNKRISLFSPKNAADGKGNFFIKIATYIVSQPQFQELSAIIGDIKSYQFGFQDVNADLETLAKGIRAVQLLNFLIRKASEDFDGLNTDEAKAARENGASCKNQISFCSKFLHFYCPGSVFIIDQYSLDGGKIAIPSQKRGYTPLFETADGSKKQVDIPSFEDYKQTHKRLLDKLNEINRNTIDEQKETENDEVERVSGYLAHCARAYCVSKYLHENNVVPSPRLIDDLFLRLQKK